MTAYNFSFDGYADSTDLSSVPGWNRISGSTGAIVVNSNGRLTFNSSTAMYRALVDSPHFKLTINFSASLTPNNSEFVFRFVDASNYLSFRSSTSGNISIRKTVATTQTTIQTVAYTPTSTDVVVVECYGTSVKLSINGIVKFDIVETSNQTGAAIGFRTTATVPPANIIDSVSVATATVESINGISTNPPVIAGEVNIVDTTDVGTVSSITVSDGTRTISGTPNMPNGDGSFTLPFPYAEGSIVPLFGAVTTTFIGVLGVGAKASILTLATDWRAVVFSAATNISSEHLGSVLSLSDNMRFYYPAVNGAVIDSDGVMEFTILPYTFLGLLHKTHSGGDYSIEHVTLAIEANGSIIVIPNSFTKTVNANALLIKSLNTRSL